MEPATEPAKLLLVDDDEDILMMLRMGLQRKGFEVHSETNPVKALETIPQLQPKLVMVDLSMPEMHGVEFLKQLASRPNRSEMRVAVGSSSANPKDREDALVAGADLFLSKPYNLKNLANQLRMLLKE